MLVPLRIDIQDLHCVPRSSIVIPSRHDHDPLPVCVGGGAARGGAEAEVGIGLGSWCGGVDCTSWVGLANALAVPPSGTPDGLGALMTREEAWKGLHGWGLGKFPVGRETANVARGIRELLGFRFSSGSS